MTTKKTYKELENEKTRGRKRYLERVQETEEAEQQIREFVPDHDEFPDNKENKNSF